MANTQGPNGYFIIGLDDKGNLHNSPPANDPAKIRGMLLKKVQEPMDVELYEHRIDDKIISVIEVPFSANKPHVIKEYIHKKSVTNMFIPIRKGTSVNAASKYDLDAMYFERGKYLSTLYSLTIGLQDLVKVLMVIKDGDSTKVLLEFHALVINRGINTDYISSGSLIIEECSDSSLVVQSFNLIGYKDNQSKSHLIEFSDFLVVNGNNTQRGILQFELDRETEDAAVIKSLDLHAKYRLEIENSIGNVYSSRSFSMETPL